MKRSRVVFGLLLGLTLLPRLALGDAREAALLRAVAAKELALDQPEPAKWQEAFDRFLEADALDASSDTKYELGFIASKLRQDDLAVGYYEDAIALGLEGPPRDKALTFIIRYGPSMARLDVRGEPGIRLQIRGVERGTLPLSKPVVVFAGACRVEVVDPSQHQSSSLSLSLESGQTKTVDLTPPTNAASSLATAGSARPVRPVALAPPSDTARPREQSIGPWLLGAGAGVLVTSAVFLPLSIWKIGSKRDQLANACDTPSANPDGCQAARLGRYDEARALAGDIAEWRTVRAIAWTGLGIGATSAALGLLMVTGRSKEKKQAGNLVVFPKADLGSLVLNWHGTF